MYVDRRHLDLFEFFICKLYHFFVSVKFIVFLILAPFLFIFSLIKYLKFCFELSFKEKSLKIFYDSLEDIYDYSLYLYRLGLNLNAKFYLYLYLLPQKKTKDFESILLIFEEEKRKKLDEYRTKFIGGRAFILQLEPSWLTEFLIKYRFYKYRIIFSKNPFIRLFTNPYFIIRKYFEKRKTEKMMQKFKPYM